MEICRCCKSANLNDAVTVWRMGIGRRGRRNEEEQSAKEVLSSRLDQVSRNNVLKSAKLLKLKSMMLKEAEKKYTRDALFRQIKSFVSDFVQKHNIFEEDVLEPKFEIEEDQNDDNESIDMISNDSRHFDAEEAEEAEEAESASPL